MKRTLFCIVSLVLASGAARASGIIACSGVPSSLNSCYAAALPTFNVQMNWDTTLSTSSSTFIAPPIDGNAYNSTWYASASFVNVTVTGAELIRADNYADFWAPGNGWTNAQGVPGFANPFTGNFDSYPDTGLQYGIGIPVTLYTNAGQQYGGEGLLGSHNASSFVIGSSTVLSTFGFRIASFTDETFDATINLYSGTDGSGYLGTLSMNSLSGGGNCSALSPSGNNAPAACNTAPFLWIDATGYSASVHSFSISTTNTSGNPDNTGFYIDALDLYAPAPEPATLLITGGGLLSLAYFIRRKRAAANRQ